MGLGLKVRCLQQHPLPQAPPALVPVRPARVQVRLVHQALVQVLQPVQQQHYKYENTFKPNRRSTDKKCPN